MGQRKLTNRFGLPDTLMLAVSNDTHINKGTISVTELIDSPQIRKLKRENDYETDVSEQIYALLGTALHHVLERSDAEHSKKKAFETVADTLMREAINRSESAPEQAQGLKNVAEYLIKLIPVLFPDLGKRYIFELTMTLDYGDLGIVSGTFDLFDKLHGILYDYKFCGTFQYIHPESRDKWNQQTNIYAYGLMTNYHYVVKAIRIVAFFRDWNRYELVKNPKSYPPRQILEIDVALRPLDRIEALILKRLDLHRRSDLGENIQCDGKDRWASATEFAVMVPNGKKAMTVQMSYELAQKFIEDNKHKKANMFIQTRHGESRRCGSYCVVSKVCPQYKKELELKEKI